VAFPILRKNNKRTFIVSDKRSLCENKKFQAGIRWLAKESLLSYPYPLGVKNVLSQPIPLCGSNIL
jgi:hypothetical protein